MLAGGMAGNGSSQKARATGIRSGISQLNEQRTRSREFIGHPLSRHHL
jgi:hypothetical protein